MMQAAFVSVEELIRKGESLPLMESFYTIQGEGCNTGKAAYFIRLAGCDVGCVWCDVKESWDANKHTVVSVEEILQGAMEQECRMVVITGGEPTMHNLQNLTDVLQQNGFTTCIETSGAYPLTGKWDWICVSPKKFKAPLPDVLKQAHELKVVIYHHSDFTWAETHAAMVNADCKLLLQPEHSKFNVVTPLIVDYVKANPQWQISLQTHKFLNIP